MPDASNVPPMRSPETSPRPTRHIVALGGGGFSMEPRNRRIDDYVLSLARKRRPRVLFLATASGDSRSYVARFMHAFRPPRATPRALELFRMEQLRESPRDIIRGQDVVYVGGGNTANMLAVWRLHGIDLALREAWRRGIVLCGVSAGAVCWFENGLTDSFGRPLRELGDGLGFLSGSMCPHYGSGGFGESDRRRRFLSGVASRRLPSGWAVDDSAAIHFSGGQVHEVVTSRPGPRAFRVERHRARAVEIPLASRLLE